MRRHMLGLLALAFALVAATALLVALSGPSRAAPTYIDTDWVINNGDVVTRQNEEIVLSGNLTVKQGGELTLRNVTLRLNSTSTQLRHIEVEDGGLLNIYDGDSSYSTTSDASLITANDATYNYVWWVRDGGELNINDSRVEECGLSSPLSDEGLYIESSSVTVDHVDFKGCYMGLIAYYASPTVSHCTFKDVSAYGVDLYSSSTDVNGCAFTSCPYGVVAYYSYPKVTDCTFTSSSTYAIYTYAADAEIDGCTITQSSYIAIITQLNSVTITDTTINDVTWYGILSYWSTLTVDRVTVNDTNVGIYCYGNAAGSSVSDSKVGNSSANGVYLYSTSASLSNVKVFDSSTNGIYLNSASGTVSDCLVEKSAVGVYLRSSTAAVKGLTVRSTTSSGVSVSGGTPTMKGFSVSGASTGISVAGAGTLKAQNGTVSSSSTRDVDVGGTSTAELTNVSFSTASTRVQGAGSLVKVYWWVDLRGVWQDGSPVASGSYTVADSGSTTVASGTLGSDGWARGLRIEQLEVNSVGTTTYTPHTFTVGKGGLSTSKVVTVDADKTVIVTVTDNVPPSGYVMDPEPPFTKGTWNQVSWTAGSDVGVGGIEYWCEMTDSPTFAYALDDTGWTAVRSHIFAGLSDGLAYYYRVRARDAVGNVGGWSNVVTSTQDSQPPSVPVVVDPPEYTKGTSLTLVWGASTDSGVGAVQYQVQYTNDPTFGTVLGTSAWQAGTSYTFSPLADGTKYYYRVRSQDGFSQGSQWSPPVHSIQDASAPPTPDMVAEPSYTKGLSNEVSWTTVVDAGVGGVQYYAEWDNDWWFPSPGGNSGWLSSTSCTFNGLPENIWIYYRVRSRDSLLQESAPSWVVWSWQDNTPPSVPVITGEPQWTAGHTNTVYWAASGDGSGAWGIEYWAEADADQAFGSPDFRSDWTSQTYYDFSSLIDGVTYYYRLKARDSLGWESSWSSTTSSTQDASSPPAPGMDTEPDYVPGTTNAVSWSQVTDAGVGGVQYEVVCSDRSDFSTTVGDSGWIGTTTYTFTGLGDGTRYYFHARSRDSFDQRSAWSGAVSSTQDATAPAAPVISTEPTYTQGTTNTIYWGAVTDAGSDSVTYWAEYDDDWQFNSPNGQSGWISAMQYTFTGIAENTWDYYRVRARDGAGNVGPWSAGFTWSRQDATAPSVPTPASEPAYTAGTSNTVSWSASTDGSGSWGIVYYVEAGTTPAIAQPVQSSGWISGTSWTFTGLGDGLTYFYHVKARDAVGNECPWSATVSSTQDASAPTVPFLTAEPGFTQGTSNSVSWSASSDTGSGGVQYEAQASTSPAFTTVTSTGWRTTTTYAFTGLSDGTTYYYRVHARDAVGQQSAWSSVESSTQDATGPSAPTIWTEPTYTAGTTNTVFWDASTDSGAGGITYYVEYDDDWRFGSPNDGSGLITATEYTFTGLAEDTWFYYHVIAMDAVGNWGGWSGLTWSRQDDSAPTAPVMAAEPTYTQGTTNTVSWSASSDGAGVGGVTYQAEAATTNTFTVVVAQSLWTDQTSWTFTGLADSWTYYYRVRARDALDHVSSNSNVVSSTQDASAPPAPFLAAEPQYTADASNTVTWTAVSDGGVGGVQYDAQRSTSPAFTTVVESGWQAGTSYTFTGLSDATTYYYRVRARDSLRTEGPWSNVERSTQDASAPSVPTLAAPPLWSDGTSLRLTWTASTDAGVGGVQYYIEYDNDFQFRSPNGNSGWISATEHTFSGLAQNTVFYYHVRARDAFAHASAWSTMRFSIQDASPPTQPTMAAEPAYTDGASNTVSWSASTDAGVGGVQYQVYADTDSDMASPVQSSGWITATSFTFSGLSDGTRYHYAVQARDSLDHRTSLSAAVSSTQDASAPTTPQMVPEPDYTQGTTNSLGWSAATDAGVGGVRYRLEWSTSAAFGALAGSLDWFDGTSATASGLSDATRYYWRVKARDSFSHETPWSNVVWSTQDASPPPSPTMAAEPTYTDETDNTVYWGEVRDAGIGGVEYYAELGTDAAFTNTIGTGWTIRTDWTFSNLGDGSRYWYRARSRDAFGQVSAWSNAVSSTQDNSAPTVPALSTEPAYTAGTTNELRWTSSTDAGVGGVEYQVQCAMDSAFASISLESPWTTATRYTFSGLSDGVTYYYRARARDAFGHISAWSQSQRSTQDAAPPSVPVLAAEPPYTQGTSNTVAWSTSSDAGIGGVQYMVQCSLDGAFARLVGASQWMNGTSFTFSGLSDGGLYFYRVRSRDLFGYMSAWSSIEASTQDASPPSTPAMVAEPPYTEGTSNTVMWTLSIDTGIGGVLYFCEWDLFPGFGNPRGSSGWVPAREWTFNGLPERVIYYHVRAMDALGQASPWSDYVSSTQDASPPTTPSLNDLPAYTKGHAVLTSWSPAVDLGIARVEYYCEWDDDPTFASPGGNSDWVASATFTFDGLPEAVALNFRVRARDAFDHRTPWSPPRVTTCDASPPSVPYLASEPPYTQGTNNRLEWSTAVDAAVGGVEYRAQATTDPTWSRIDLDSGWVKATGHTFSTLADGAVYYYRVQARDSFQWASAWSPVVSSAQDASPPPVPALGAEPAYTEGTANSLEWLAVVDAGVGGVEYEVQWATVRTFSTVGGDSGWTRDTRWTFAGLPEGAPTYYRLRARDAFDQASEWSADVSSQQDASPPQVPVMRPEPAHTSGAANTVEWLAALDAGVGGVQYLVQSSVSATFADVVAESGWISQTRYTFRSLADGVAYSYRVRARDAFGHESAWSTAVASTQDASAPAVAFDPLPAVVASTTLRITGTAVDAGAGVASVEVSVDGGRTWANTTLSPGMWTWTWTRYASGVHTVLARATDRLGNVLAPPASVDIDVDLDAPEALITSPAENATLTGLAGIRGTAADPHIARYGLYWTRNGVNLTPIVEDQPFAVTGGTLAIWDTRGLDDGEVEVILEVNDTTGRSTRHNVTVRLLNSDMEISPGDLLISNPFPDEGDNMSISATFRNTGTSRARDVKITIADNDRVLYESHHTIPAGDSVTITVPYVVPDHKVLHVIRVSATYRDNPDDKGASATASFTGREVIEEPFFSASELATLLIAVVVAILGSLLGAWWLDRRRGPAVAVAAAPAAGGAATFASMQKMGADQIAWDDDRF